MWLKSVLVRYEKYGTLSIYGVETGLVVSLSCIEHQNLSNANGNSETKLYGVFN